MSNDIHTHSSVPRSVPRAAPEAVGSHPLYRPGVIRMLWIGAGVILGLLTLADILVHGHPYFGIDGTFGFFSWYGFVTCAAMVIVAKFVMGKILSRKDTYYVDR